MNDDMEGHRRYFLVDYENVNRDGLVGVEHLSKQDDVIIYYSDAAETLSFGLHKRMNKSEAHFVYRKVRIPIKNAVDCRMLFDLEILLKEDKEAEYYIISRDNDFDNAIEMFVSHHCNVRKLPQISDVDGMVKGKPFKMNQREARIRSFFGQHFSEKKYKEHKEEIIRAVLDAESKQQVNNNLTALFHSGEIVRDIYKKLKPMIRELPGST